MDEQLTDRRPCPDCRGGPWLLALLIAVGALGTDLQGQSRLERECPATLTLATSPSFDDPPESLRYEWRDGQGTVLGRESRLTVELHVGTHTHVSVVTAPDGRTARDQITVVVEDTRPPDLGVGRRQLDLPAVAADDAGMDLVAAMGVTADDACDPGAPAVTWDPPPPYPAGDTTVTFAATDRAGNRASTQALVRVAAGALRPEAISPAGSRRETDASASLDPRAPGPATSASTPPRGDSTPVPPEHGSGATAPPALGTGTGAPPATGAGTGDGNAGALDRAEAGADLRVSGGPASTADGLSPGDGGTAVTFAERAGSSATSAGATTPLGQDSSPAVFGFGVPASGLRWGGVALGVGMLFVAWLLVIRRRTRASPTATPTPTVFRAVARPNANAVHTIRPSYVPPRYRLDLRPHAAVGTHTVVQSDETPTSREEP